MLQGSISQYRPLATAGVTALVALTLSGCKPNSNQHNDAQQTIAATQNAAAHWLSADTLLIQLANGVDKVELIVTSKDGESTSYSLTAINSPATLLDKYPHLAQLSAYQLPSEINAKQALKGQVQVRQYKAGTLLVGSQVQTYGVLDALYTAGSNDADEINNYGASVYNSAIEFKLWSPTATKVAVLLFDQNKSPIGRIAMSEDPATGVWQLTTNQASAFDYYQYQIDVFHPSTGKFESLITTDPYSLSLSTNSKYSQIVDLNDSRMLPNGWANHAVPTVAAPEDLILYETHIRDFSAADDALSNDEFRGKYKAFSETASHGMKHLFKLRDAGLNTVHLLPTYDLSTINEDPAVAIDINDPVAKACKLIDLSYCDQQELSSKTIKQLLESFDPASREAGDLMEVIRDQDNYNWGYDPYHYTVPEGSYAVNPEGENRIVEFREMVTSLHKQGFRVIMDVVYNHTFASGLAEKSVLDKVVPNYYHRYHAITGEMERSTCCDNSATEHKMMEKLMVDSLVVWARDYKIDGFRFDLMGHQPKDAMLRAREAVWQVDPDNYFYGEGWNFGEVANNAQFVQAIQSELTGTEIGTFTDRMRDAIRGGAPFDSAEGIRKGQGVTNGLYVIPNELQPQDIQREEYLLSMDQVRVGLAGNLQNVQLTNANDELVTGKDIPYGGDPTGYAGDPADTVNYVSKHDNQTLWDNNQYRIAYHVSSDDRVRMQNLSLAYPLLSQGIPFLHMGSELLRSKSFLRDSYDYGDWFNYVDFSYQSNNYNVGLPPAVKDQDNWPVITKLLKNNEGRDKVSPSQIKFAAEVFAEFIKIRSQSPLLRLRTAEQIQQRVRFHNSGKDQQAGLIVMSISDTVGDDLDANYEAMLLVFNNSAKTQQVKFDSQGYKLHPVQAQGVDKQLKSSKTTSNGFSVAALSAAVFVK